MTCHFLEGCGKETELQELRTVEAKQQGLSVFGETASVEASLLLTLVEPSPLQTGPCLTTMYTTSLDVLCLLTSLLEILSP